MTPDLKGAAAYRQWRRRLGLSHKGVVALLRREGEYAERASERWQAEGNVPSEVVLLFELVTTYPDAAAHAKLPMLRQQFPWRPIRKQR